MVVHRCCKWRRGLAPLELVLCLPLLLMIMALMVNIGTVASWKIRALGVARNVAWAARWPRSASSNPAPSYWPTSGSSGTSSLSINATGPQLDLPVAPGGQFISALLNPTLGFVEGHASLSRQFPMLAKLGAYQLNANTCLLDQPWQIGDMGTEYNLTRRTAVISTKVNPSNTSKVIYWMPADDQGDTAFTNAVNQFRQYEPQLGPLFPYTKAWGDPEEKSYNAQYKISYSYKGAYLQPGLYLGYSTACACSVPAGCTTDTDVVQTAVDDLIKRIGEDDDPPNDHQSVARSVAQKYQSMYTALQKAGDPDLTLQQKIDALNDFLGKLN